MTPKRRNGGGNINVWPSRHNHHMCGPSSSKRKPKPHFFKMIIQSTIDNKKLKIPKVFVKIYGKELASSVATVSLPDGRTWKLGLERANGRTSFVVGWQRFVDHYSIRSGYCLLFRYDGFSKFHVYILDNRSIEIYYPYNAQSATFDDDSEDHEVEPTYDDDDDDDDEDGAAADDDDRDVDDDFEPNTHFSSKRMIHINGSLVQQGRKRTIMSPGDGGLSATDEGQMLFTSRNFSQIKITKESTRRAIQAATERKLKNPSFMVVMEQNNTERHNCPNVPAEFVKKYMMNSSGYINLGIPRRKKQWHVRCTPIHKNRWAMKLSKGWGAFKRDNKLKKDDVCVFELMKKNDILLKVSIYRAAEYAHRGI